MIKLSTLTPESVAYEVLDWARSHVSSLLFAAGNPDHDSVDLPGGSLRRETFSLTHYAQTGALPDGDRIAGYLQTVVEALYTAAHPDVYGDVQGDWQREGEPRQAIDVVLRAALARDAIAQGQRVPIAWIASLVELPVATLRQYATPSRGELRTFRDGTITAHEARRWLSGRGVTGFR